MKAIIVICLLSALSLTCQRSSATQNNECPFASTLPPSSFSPGPEISKITNFNCSIKNGRAFLNWTIDENQDTDQFEIERSIDGKNFVVAALVFGTDKPDTDNYQFYEKTRSKKIYYRIKILYKDQTIAYSDIIIAQTR